MSRTSMSDLAYDIEQLYIEGYGPKSIALQLDCPIEMVYAWLESESLEDTAEQDPAVSKAVFAKMVEELSPFETVNS